MANSENKSRSVPLREDLIGLFEAAAVNARSLVAHAEVLMGAGSIARAHALAVFAAEELGRLREPGLSQFNTRPCASTSCS
jgi:hypothetical protein